MVNTYYQGIGYLPYYYEENGEKRIIMFTIVLVLFILLVICGYREANEARKTG